MQGRWSFRFFPSNHLVTIDFEKYNLPRPSPCICDSPTCSLTAYTPSLLDAIHCTHPTRSQTSMDHYITITNTTPSRQPTTQLPHNVRSHSSITSQRTMSRYLIPTASHMPISDSEHQQTAHTTPTHMSGPNAEQQLTANNLLADILVSPPLSNLLIGPPFPNPIDGSSPRSSPSDPLLSTHALRNPRCPPSDPPRQSCPYCPLRPHQPPGALLQTPHH